MLRKGKTSGSQPPADDAQTAIVPAVLEWLPDQNQITDDTPLALPGISNFRQLYDVFGSHSDPQFPQRVFEGKAFRHLIECGASREWLEEVCEDVDELSYDQKVFVSGRRTIIEFNLALR